MQNSYNVTNAVSGSGLRRLSSEGEPIASPLPLMQTGLTFCMKDSAMIIERDVNLTPAARAS